MTARKVTAPKGKTYTVSTESKREFPTLAEAVAYATTFPLDVDVTVYPTGDHPYF